MKKILLALAFLTTASFANYYGALAYNDYTGAYGYSYDYRTQHKANKRALAECGRGCEVVVEFQNTCAAYAVGNDAWGFGYAYKERQAQNIAIGECSKYGRGCEVVVWACTTR